MGQAWIQLHFLRRPTLRQEPQGTGSGSRLWCLSGQGPHPRSEHWSSQLSHSATLTPTDNGLAHWGGAGASETTARSERLGRKDKEGRSVSVYACAQRRGHGPRRRRSVPRSRSIRTDAAATACGWCTKGGQRDEAMTAEGWYTVQPLLCHSRTRTKGWTT